MRDLKANAIAVGVIVLGMVALIEGLIVLDIVVYLGVTANTHSDKVAAAYEDGYQEGHAETYSDAYQVAYREAHSRGYDKGYEISLLRLLKGDAPSQVELHNPTYAELRQFLTRDQTDANPFVRGQYVCFHFAADLNNNAEASGIRAAYVRIHSEEWGHAVVAFDTVDRGLVFIEPQSDKDVELVIGRAYLWQSAGADRPVYYDSAIDEIQIIW